MICSLGKAGCTGAVENAVHKWTSGGKPEDSLLCCHHDSGSFSSDIFRTLGCQWVEAEYKRAQRGKGLQKNILITNHVSENIFKMTILHVQWWLWSACGDLLMQWCGLSLARMRMKRTSFLSYQSWRTAACSFQKIQVRHERRAAWTTPQLWRTKTKHDHCYKNSSRITTLHWHVSVASASLTMNMLTTCYLKRCILLSLCCIKHPC